MARERIEREGYLGRFLGRRGLPAFLGASPSSSRSNAAIPSSPARFLTFSCSSGVTGNRIWMVAGTCGFLGMAKNHSDGSLTRDFRGVTTNLSHKYIDAGTNLS